ncbi:hypothetical protein [Lysinibacillus sp. TE18511]
MTYISAAAASLALRFRAKNICRPETLERSGCFLCESEASAANVYLCESEASAANVYLCESEASAANVLSARKRSVSGKCFICAKAKRQQQSAQPERKSTSRYDEQSIKEKREGNGSTKINEIDTRCHGSGNLCSWGSY